MSRFGNDFVSNLRKGIVLNLNPNNIKKNGAIPICVSIDRRVKGRHFFLCVDVKSNSSTWLPLFATPGFGRVPISYSGRHGHPAWTNGSFFYHTEQVWIIPHDTLARTYTDLSIQQGSPNTLDELFVPAVND